MNLYNKNIIDHFKLVIGDRDNEKDVTGYRRYHSMLRSILGNFRMTLGTLLEHPFHFKGAFGKKMSHKKCEALKMTFFAR